MPLHVTSRTRRHTDASQVPSTLQVGTAVLAGLHESGMLRTVEGWFPLSRRAGHGTRGLFAFAIVFLLSGRSWGIRPFTSEFATALRRLVAPVAGLRVLPTASSVSRALGDFSHAAVRACLDPLLTSDRDVRRVLASPHVQHRDAHGRGWHVLDVDPTVEAFRQRGLPEDPALPAPVRLAPGVPGYTGHKRGELRIRHIPLQHAGSGLWLGYRLDAAGGSVLPLLADVVRLGRRAVVDVEADANVVVRADGEFGSVGAMQTMLREGAAVLTRLSRYALLDRDEVVAMLPEVTWLAVESAGGGPARTAADLGLFTLFPRDGVAAAADGAVEVRVVVTRFARSGPVDHGVLRDGHQLELFATTLPADAWPANDVAALYFGRGAMENRFAQEDRELGIDRTFSFHPPGQEWMSGIALFLWNVLLGRGVAANPLPPQPAPQAARAESALPPTPPASPTQEAAAGSAVLASDEGASLRPPPAQVASPQLPCPEPPEESIGVGPEADLHAELWAITREAFSDLPSIAGWRLDDEKMEVRCPNDKRLFAYSTDRHECIGPRGIHVKNRLYIRTQATACDGCPVRAACRSSDRPGVPKQLARQVSEQVMVRATELVHALRKLRRPAKIHRAIAARRERNAAAGVHARSATALPPMSPIPAAPTGVLQPKAPLFLPAQSRAHARRILRGLTLHVHVASRRKPHLPGHPLPALDAADRQRRRRSWRQRAERWQGPAATLVVSGPGARLVLERLISRDTVGLSP